MDIVKELTKQYKQLVYGGNWSEVNLKDVLQDISLAEAEINIGSLNSIHQLTHHIHYYILIQIQVLKGMTMKGTDADSFKAKPLKCEDDWEIYKASILTDADLYIQWIESFPKEKLTDVFINEKYGNYHRNLYGNLEHIYYHMGQIALLKKMIRKQL